MRNSLAESLASLPPAERARRIASLSDEDVQAALYHWPLWARPAQIAPPGDWTTWLILAGRGFGKTRSGAEWVREKAETHEKVRIALVARTAADVRDTIIEGESGILAISHPSFRPVYEPSKRRLTWPNGSTATTFTADEPDLLRGPQHHFAWADELAAWRYPDAWDQLLFGLRLGARPQVVVTTTPRPTSLIRALAADPTTRVTRGSTYDNRANLAPAFVAQIVRKFEGTRLGRQELDGEILDDAPGALWKRDQLDALRVKAAPELRRIVVAIDPAVTSGDGSDETGIVVVGVGKDGHGYVLDDLSGRMPAVEWLRLAVREYRARKADRVIAEVNNGGDLVEASLRSVDPNISFKAVRASRGKVTRAEPIASLYEQGKVHHVGVLPALEDQLCGWDPALSDRSPDRLDALVWGLTELMVDGASQPTRGAPRPTFTDFDSSALG